MNYCASPRNTHRAQEETLRGVLRVVPGSAGVAPETAIKQPKRTPRLYFHSSHPGRAPYSTPSETSQGTSFALRRQYAENSPASTKKVRHPNVNVLVLHHVHVSNLLDITSPSLSAGFMHPLAAWHGLFCTGEGASLQPISGGPNRVHAEPVSLQGFKVKLTLEIPQRRSISGPGPTGASLEYTARAPCVRVCFKISAA